MLSPATPQGLCGDRVTRSPPLASVDADSQVGCFAVRSFEYRRLRPRWQRPRRVAMGGHEWPTDQTRRNASDGELDRPRIAGRRHLAAPPRDRRRRDGPAGRCRQAKGDRGQYIVVMKHAAGAVATDRAQWTARARGGRVLRTYSRALRGFSAKLSDRALADVRSDPAVAYVEPDAVISIAATQSAATCGLDRIDQRSLPLNDHLHVPTDRRRRHRLHHRHRHPHTHTEFGGRAAAASTPSTTAPAPRTATATGRTSPGRSAAATYGVAKGVTLVAVRVLDCDGSGTTSGVIAGIDWVTGEPRGGSRRSPT